MINQIHTTIFFGQIIISHFYRISVFYKGGVMAMNVW
jgi:hypothetical protein